MVDPSELIPDREAADELRVKPATLAAWRCEDRGPSYVKIGRRIFYRRHDLQAWLASQLHHPARVSDRDRAA
jgi:hypothetical protein